MSDASRSTIPDFALFGIEVINDTALGVDPHATDSHPGAQP
ncbi:MAG: hypothetical protein ACO1O4_17155 [Devosia sp.]